MNAEQLRAAFEAWYASRHETYDTTFIYYTPENRYQRPSVDESWSAYQAGRAALQSQDREDAARYRWLRNRASTEGICVVHIDYWSDEYRGQAHCEVYDGEFLDKEIDHARRIEGEGE